MTPSFRPLGELLVNADELGDGGWLFLVDEVWTRTTLGAVLELDEVAPHEEGDPDAGISQFAKDHRLRVALDAATVQDIGRAFHHYFDRDAFIEL